MLCESEVKAAVQETIDSTADRVSLAKIMQHFYFGDGLLSEEYDKIFRGVQ